MSSISAVNPYIFPLPPLMPADIREHQNPVLPCPESILRTLVVLKVPFVGFDEALHSGQIVIHEDCVEDVADFFDLLRDLRFPVASVIPVAHSSFGWNDDLSMLANNSSGFNYRTVTAGNKLSMHAYGRAFDLNPIQNPYILGETILPQGAKYDLAIPGTLTWNSPPVQFLVRKGWRWGGRHPEWERLVDYQHFEKPW